MILKTHKHSYSIFQTTRSYREANVYLATASQSDSIYLINEILCPTVIRTSINAILPIQQERSCSQFVEIFSLDSKLYLVFTYLKPRLLADYISKNSLTFEDKLKLLENYLFQLAAATGLPWPILISLTDLNNINVQPDETVYFNFALNPQYLEQAANKAVLLENITKIIALIFSQELNSSQGKQLHLIMEKCQKSIYKSIPEIIKDVKSIDTTSFWDKYNQYLQAKKVQLKTVKDFSMVLLIGLVVILIYFKVITPAAMPVTGSNLPISQVGEIFFEEKKSTSSEQQGQELPIIINVPVK